jgi:CheY-like chemotaxis protein
LRRLTVYTVQGQEYIKVLVADDDEGVLECYREAFGDEDRMGETQVLDDLAAELFESESDSNDEPRFKITACNQGGDAIQCAEKARSDGEPYDVVILDVRMPPGIDGVEAGSQIRMMDPEIEIVFVTGFSDLPFEELQRKIPPPMHLHYFNKPLSFRRLAEDVATMVRN